MTAEDLAEFQSEWVEPVSTDYRGWKSLRNAAQQPGHRRARDAQHHGDVSARAIMRRAERWKICTMKIEAQKLAYEDLRRYVADPRFAKLPTAGLISKRLRARARRADPPPARPTARLRPGKPPATAGDTIYLSVVDRDGNIASLIQSVYLSFGSGVAVDDYGFHLQNRGGLFELDPDSPQRAGARASGRCTPSFRPSWRRATSTSASASWAARTRRRPTRSSSPIWWITA